MITTKTRVRGEPTHEEMKAVYDSQGESSGAHLVGHEELKDVIVDLACGKLQHAKQLVQKEVMLRREKSAVSELNAALERAAAMLLQAVESSPSEYPVEGRKSSWFESWRIDAKQFLREIGYVPF